MFCTNCGSEVNKKDKFCGNCGFRPNYNPNEARNKKKDISSVIGFTLIGVLMLVGLGMLIYRSVSKNNDVTNSQKEEFATECEYEESSDITTNAESYSELDEEMEEHEDITEEVTDKDIIDKKIKTITIESYYIEGEGKYKVEQHTYDDLDNETVKVYFDDILQQEHCYDSKGNILNSVICDNSGEGIEQITIYLYDENDRNVRKEIYQGDILYEYTDTEFDTNDNITKNTTYRYYSESEEWREIESTESTYEYEYEGETIVKEYEYDSDGNLKYETEYDKDGEYISKKYIQA